MAARRTETLSRFCGNITVVAPEIRPEMEALARCHRRAFDPADLEGADLVIAATDDPALCDFYFPGVAVRDNAVIGVTASGKDHKRAAELTRRVREILEEDML